MVPIPPQRLLLCPVCPFANNFATADALEMHLAMCHYPNCLPYPCITGCRGMARFPTEAALRRHSREHRLANYEEVELQKERFCRVGFQVSFQPRTDDERFQVGRIRAHLRSALTESNPNGSSDDEEDVKFLIEKGTTTTAALATKAAMGGMNEAGGSITATTSTSASTHVMAPPPLGGSAATFACASNVNPEANVGEMVSGHTPVASYSRSRIDGQPGNNDAVGTSAWRQSTPTAGTGLSYPQSSSTAVASASARANGQSHGGEEAGVGRVPSGQVAFNLSEAPSSCVQCTQQPPPIGAARARLQLLAAVGCSARCTCGALLCTSSKRNLEISKVRHVNSHLKIALHECRLCSTTFNGYTIGHLYRHLRSSHPHLRRATVDELKRHCISHRSKANTERLRRAVERYFPIAERI